MSNTKRRNSLPRFVIVGLSVLAGLGIWISIARPHSSPATVTSGSTANFGPGDNFLSPAQSANNNAPYYPQPAPAPRFRTRAS